MFDPGNRLIVALDVPDRDAATSLIDTLAGEASWLKIGLELFIAAGPEFVRECVAAGHSVMLDLKLHDIPATVGRAMLRVSALRVGLVTIHSGGGRAMMEAAVKAVRSGANGTSGRTHILAVTALTSLDDNDLRSVGIGDPMLNLVMRRAQLAMEAGCDGVVASPHEASRLRKGAPSDFLIVTPGVRPVVDGGDDQKRVMTPAQARSAGADMVVVGRPIRDAENPAAAARAIAATLS